MKIFPAMWRRRLKAVAVNVVTKTIVTLGLGVGPVKKYRDHIMSIAHGMEQFEKTKDGHWDMPGAVARIETLEEYVRAYLQRPFKKNFIQRAKFRRPKLQYIPKPDTPIRRQAVNPIILHFLEAAELDKYGDYQAIIDGEPESGPDFTDTETWNEYWQAREERDKLGAVALARAKELMADEQGPDTKFSNWVFDDLEKEIDALSATLTKAPDKRMASMKASKYLGAMGSAVK